MQWNKTIAHGKKGMPRRRKQLQTYVFPTEGTTCHGRNRGWGDGVPRSHELDEEHGAEKMSQLKRKRMDASHQRSIDVVACRFMPDEQYAGAFSWPYHSRDRPANCPRQRDHASLEQGHFTSNGKIFHGGSTEGVYRRSIYPSVAKYLHVGPTEIWCFTQDKDNLISSILLIFASIGIRGRFECPVQF